MDRALVFRAQRGDHEAFERLAIAAAPGLDILARLITRDPERAKDAVQEALVRAWRDLPTLREPDRFEAWLRRLLVHACTDVLRRVRRWSIEVELLDVHRADGDLAAAIANRDAIERAFGKLDPDLRAVVVLHYYLGLTLPDVADAVGIPVGTAKSRLHRALGQLRLTMAPPALGRVNVEGEVIR
jgi:RNA polymerase sigma-70 factor (ECF subfamily)